MTVRVARGLVGGLLWLVQAGGAQGAAALQAGERPVVVEDAGGGPSDCERIRDVAVRALPWIETEAGFAYPLEGPVHIAVYATKAATGNEVGYYDHAARVIRVWARINSAHVVHELAHAWFGNRFAADFGGGDRWLIEGLAQFTAVRVLARDLVLGDPVQVHRAIREDAQRAPAGWDPPLAAWHPAFPIPADATPEDTARRYGWYGKAYGFFHVVRACGGADGLGRVNARVAAGGPVTTARYLEWLTAEVPALQGVGAGWVRAGPYGAAFADALGADDDGDGLSNGEERLFGTAPARPDTDGDGESDGREVYVTRTDPADAASRPAVAWPPHPDTRSQPAGPVRVLSAGVTAHDLCLELAVADGFAATGVHYNIGIDTAANDRFDWIVGFGGGAPPWVGRVARVFERTDWHALRLAVLTIGERRARLRVPLRALDASGPVRLFAYQVVRSAAGVWTRGEGLGWVSVTLPPR